MNSKNTFSILIGMSFLVIITFAVIKWLDIPAGTLIDWATGLVAFWLLLGVSTAPWDMYFKAREILTDSQISTQKNIAFRPEDEAYTRRISRIYLFVAVGLHLITALLLYGLAYFGVSAIGYWASIVALLLTFMRPVYRLHEYVVFRLSNIGQSVLYPRQDIETLQAQVNVLEGNFNYIQSQLDETSHDSWISTQKRETELVREQVQQARIALENLKINNQTEHQQLVKKAEDSLAKISEDAQFLNQVRDLIRFVKNA